VKRILAIAILAVLAAGSAQAARAPAMVRIVSQGPLVVRGAHFRSKERVRVTAVASNSLARTVVATRTGSFTVEFQALERDRCSGLSVRARGSQGTEATAKLLPQPMCLPQRSP
jgi:hypothetical protein